MSSKIKLLPCPCCGSGTETEIGIIARKHFMFYQAVCLKCGLTAKATPTPELTASLWNTRKPMDKILEQLEEKKKEYLDGFSTHKESELYGVACGFGDSIKIIKEGDKV